MILNNLANYHTLSTFTEQEIEFPNIFGGLSFQLFEGFSIFGFKIYWYGVIIALGVLLSFIYLMRRSKSFGLISDKVFDVIFVALIGAFLGARIYFVVFHNLNPENADNQYDLVRTFSFSGLRQGGLAVYGGIIGGFIFGTITAIIKKVKLLPLYDVVGCSIFIGQAIGRWGNFINQEAYGAPTAGDLPWGMTGSGISAEVGANILVHPTFLYESLWTLVGFLLIHFYSKKFKTFDGELILLYVFWYGAGRSWIEGLRTDSLMLGEFRISQMLAIVSAIAALTTYIIFKVYFAKKGNVLFADTDESKQQIADYEEMLRLEKEKKNQVAPSILAEDIADENDADVSDEATDESENSTDEEADVENTTETLESDETDIDTKEE